MNEPVSPLRRRRRRVLLAIASIAFLLLLAVGCTSTVTPPPTPTDPVRVFLLQEALHTGLVLPPDGDGDDAEYVQFGFGDWSWYALGNDAWYHAFATVLWPTQGGLGRRTFGARTATELQARVTWATLAPIDVSGAKARTLRRQLQTEFDAHIAQAVARTDLAFRFVPVDQSYWLPHNCADEVATWLRALDCKVTGALFRTGLCLQRQGD